MSHYHAGRRAEYKAQRILEAAGYQTIRAASSKGVADVVAWRPGDKVRLVSVKSGGARLSGVEREMLESLARNCYGAYTVECWRFPPRCREPLIETF